MTNMRHGWIDEVEDGIVWGHLVDGENDVGFHVRLLDVMESQRVELQPGSFCSIVNGELVIDTRIWTTHELDQADERATRIWHELFASSPLPSKDSQ